ncbi:MAG: RluA family pseudouridine synthase [Verrucomicrobiota bacterium]
MNSPAVIKLSSPATREFWEIPVLFEDAHLLALDKPAGLRTVPEQENPELPSLVALLHAGIAAGKPWSQERGLSYLMNAHRLDFDTSGVVLLAKDKPTLLPIADLFGTDKPVRKYLALIRGEPLHDTFEVEAKLAPHPVMPGTMRIDPDGGKKAKTRFEVVEKFPRAGMALLKCEPVTDRPHQIRVHLRHAGFTVVGDQLYGGKPLWLSRIKSDYRLKPGREERPLLARVALHAESLEISLPGREPLTIQAELPKDLKVALKYLRQFAA